MKFKYCTQCASMNITKQMGMDKCAKCGSTSISEGAMDQINALQKGKAGSGSSMPTPAGPKPGGLNSLREKVNAMKGKKTDDFEII